MIHKIKNWLVIFLPLMLLSCGFKSINQKNENIIYFQNITVIGEPRLTFRLKNNILLISSNLSEKKYDAQIKLTKQKTTKIKNKAGKSERYNISLSVSLELVSLNNGVKISNNFTKNADYNVAEIHSDTVRNENNITKKLLEQLSEDIINYITFSMRGG
tara:strand:+ start:192 stop:668 length:477 start_codon:yes stop_codon:yes gene_type:complete